MFSKIVALLLSKETQGQLVERIMKNPKTSWIAVVLVAIFGGVVSLNEAGFKLAAGLLGGVGFLVAFFALLFGVDAPKDDHKEDEPKDPTAPPAVG